MLNIFNPKNHLNCKIIKFKKYNFYLKVDMVMSIRYLIKKKKKRIMH